VTLIPTLLVWLPFILKIDNVLGIPLAKNGLQTIVSNYDGPLYMVVAKSFYSPQIIKESFAFPLPVEYYAAHFPLFPLLQSLILVAIFAVFPARWLIVRSVGSPEPLFVAAIIASLYYFKNKKYLLAGVFGALAQLTKSPGILLFGAYGVIWVFDLLHNLALINQRVKRKINLKLLPILLIPLALFSVFYFYKVTYGTFTAYFNSGDNIHLFFPPFQIFNYSAPWVGTFWLEEVILIYAAGLLASIYLIKDKDQTLATFATLFFTSLLFVSHRDLLRYALPLIPFMFIAFRNFMVSKEVRIVILFLLIPTYLFSLGFISQNVMPIADWSPFL